MKTAWTDYPFDFLGDKPNFKAPVRPVWVVSYDGNKYVKIIVSGVEAEVKSGYIYEKPGRLGEVPPLFPRTHIGKYYD